MSAPTSKEIFNSYAPTVIPPVAMIVLTPDFNAEYGTNTTAFVLHEVLKGLDKPLTIDEWKKVHGHQWFAKPGKADTLPKLVDEITAIKSNFGDSEIGGVMRSVDSRIVVSNGTHVLNLRQVYTMLQHSLDKRAAFEANSEPKVLHMQRMLTAAMAPGSI